MGSTGTSFCSSPLQAATAAMAQRCPRCHWRHTVLEQDPGESCDSSEHEEEEFHNPVRSRVLECWHSHIPQIWVDILNTRGLCAPEVKVGFAGSGFGSDSFSARTLPSATHGVRAQENTKWMDGAIRLQRRSAPSTTPVSNRWYNATLGRPAARAFFVRDSRSGRERTERSVESTSTPKKANSGFGPRGWDALHWSFTWSPHPF